VWLPSQACIAREKAFSSIALSNRAVVFAWGAQSKRALAEFGSGAVLLRTRSVTDLNVASSTSTRRALEAWRRLLHTTHVSFRWPHCWRRTSFTTVWGTSTKALSTVCPSSRISRVTFMSTQLLAPRAKARVPEDPMLLGQVTAKRATVMRMRTRRGERTTWRRPIVLLHFFLGLPGCCVTFRWIWWTRMAMRSRPTNISSDVFSHSRPTRKALGSATKFAASSATSSTTANAARSAGP